MPRPIPAPSPLDELALGNYNVQRRLPQFRNDQFAQDLLGPLEHAQAARDAASTNPLAGLGIGMLSSGYEATKVARNAGVPGAQGMLDFANRFNAGAGEAKESRPSSDNITSPLFGAAEGTGDWLKAQLHSLAGFLGLGD